MARNMSFLFLIISDIYVVTLLDGSLNFYNQLLRSKDNICIELNADLFR